MKRILFFTVIAIAILSMVHSVESVYNLWQKQNIISQTQKRVQTDEKENKKLQEQLHVISQSSFVEEEARNKLFMVKPGEQMVFIPADALASPSGTPETSVDLLSSWEQWWRLFFN